MERLLGFGDPLSSIGVAGDVAVLREIESPGISLVGRTPVAGERQGFGQGELIGRVIRSQGHSLSSLGQGPIGISGSRGPARGAGIKKGESAAGPGFFQFRIRFRRLVKKLLDSRQGIQGRRRPFPGLNPQSGSLPVLAWGARGGNAQTPLGGLNGRDGFGPPPGGVGIMIDKPDLGSHGPQQPLDPRRISLGSLQIGLRGSPDCRQGAHSI